MGNGVADIFQGVLSFLTLGPIDRDNWNFKLHSKLSPALFFVASTASFFTSYFGKSIQCFGSGDKEFVESKCWLHGSYHISNIILDKKINGGESCFSPSPDQILLNGVHGQCDENKGCDASNKPHTEYYIWVTWILLLNGALFILPNLLWGFLEGGKIKEYELENDKTKAKEAARKFSASSSKAKRSYFRKFVFMECLNLGVVILNFLIIDLFLTGNFSSYGIDAVNYLLGQTEKTETQFTDEPIALNPMCNVFPTMVSCPLKTGSTVLNAVDSKWELCLLSQNKVNQIIYIILWWWFMVLFLSNGLMMIYRIVTMVNVGNARHKKLRYLMKTNDEKHDPTTEKFRHNLQVGEWFLLTQIGRNCKPHFFRSVMENVVNPPKEEDNETRLQNQNNGNRQQSNVNADSQRSAEDPEGQAITFQQLQSTAEERERLAIT